METEKTIKLWKRLFGYSVGDIVRVNCPKYWSYHRYTGVIIHVFPYEHRIRYVVRFPNPSRNFPFKEESLVYVGSVIKKP